MVVEKVADLADLMAVLTALRTVGDLVGWWAAY
jgi:hypothetical protein